MDPPPPPSGIPRQNPAHHSRGGEKPSNPPMNHRGEKGKLETLALTGKMADEVGVSHTQGVSFSDFGSLTFACPLVGDFVAAAVKANPKP